MSFHRHLFAQGRGLAALARFVAHGPSSGLPALPGPVIERTVPAPSAALVADFVRFCGGDPSQHKHALPPHLFSQWSLPLLLEVARELPYPPVKVINAGFRLQVNEPLPPGRPLDVRGQLLRVQETDRRAEITIAVETLDASGAPALRAELDVFVPLTRATTKSAPRKKERHQVPADLRLLTRRPLKSTAGRDFAELTGDVNPLHWLPAYARAMRFPNVILHGFGTAAIAYEAIGKVLLSGQFARIVRFEARFQSPVVLPGEISVFVGANNGERRDVVVGAAPGGPVYVSGSARIVPRDEA